MNEAAALRIEIQGLANELFRNLADADPENGDLGKGVLERDLERMFPDAGVSEATG